MDVSAIVTSVIPVVQQVLAGLLHSSGSGLFGKMREGAAIANFLGDTAANFGDNPIINGLVDAFMKGDAAKQLSEITGEAASVDNVMGAVGNLDGLLGEAGEQGAQVKQFIFGLAEKVAGASGDGLFGSGDKIGENEQAFLNTLKGKLGL